MTEHKKGAGEYRKDIYKIIQQTIGRDLSSNEHTYLSKLLQDYVRAHAPTVPLTSSRISHDYICLKCRGVQSGSGREFAHRMNRQARKSLAEESKKQSVTEKTI